MRKIVCAFVAFLMIVPLHACGNTADAPTDAACQECISKGMTLATIAKAGTLMIGDSIEIEGERYYLVDDPRYASFNDFRTAFTRYFTDEKTDDILSVDWYLEKDGMFLVRGEGSGSRTDWDDVTIEKKTPEVSRCTVKASVKALSGTEIPDTLHYSFVFVKQADKWVIADFTQLI